MTIERETLYLPPTYSLGRITVYLPNERDPCELLEAIGPVQVPKSAKLFLDVSQEVCDDLRGLRTAPRRLLENGVSFIQKNLQKTDLREVIVFEPRHLVITYCSGLTVDQLQQLGELRSLKHLSLSHTLLNVPDFSWIPQFPSLNTLFLLGTDADDACVPFVVSIAGLEELDLAECKLTDRGVQAIWRSVNIKRVNLRGCQIGDKALKGIGYCALLESLNISGTRISDSGVEVIVAEALQNNRQLSALNLRSCHITDGALVRLSSLKSLSMIDLTDTEVTPQGAAFLKRSLPGCNVRVGREKAGRSKL
ncbi:MAG TPA: hypothetical protein VJO16_06450 [Candidatus Acidoferrum sp.]|nr:hypothetical protein [Candidatus Acidoferrum sp.]